MKTIKNKWTISWILLGIIFVVYSAYIWENPTATAFIQIGYILITLIAMVLIMLHTFASANDSAAKQIEVFKEESLKQIKAIADSTQLQIDHLKTGTKEQIEAFKTSTEKQISTIQTESEKQINAIQNSTKVQLAEMQKNNSEQITAIQNASEKQTNAIQTATEKQIENLQGSTEKQINSFVEQTNSIVDRLEKLSETMEDLTELNKEMLENEKELREIEQQKAKKREQELQNNYIDKIERVERIRPDIHFRTEVDTYMLVFNYIYVYLYNTGGDASSITINVSLKNSSTYETTRPVTKTFFNVGRMRQTSFRYLRAKHYTNYDQVIIEASIRDVQHREYYGHWIFQRTDNVWLRIDANERNLLGTKANQFLK